MSQPEEFTENPPESYDDGYDDSIPTPGYAVNPATEHDPNAPHPGETQLNWDDRPPVDGGAAPEAVHPRTGEMLRPDGSPALPKGGA